MSDAPLLTIALGGNALSPPGGDQSFTAERAMVRTTALALGTLTRMGFRLLIVHGNGPQVGRLLHDDADIADLDLRVAQTQGELGFLLAHALERATGESCVALVTRVTVDPADPAFGEPTKPIGPLLTTRPSYGPSVALPGGFRRIVASPRPVDIIETEPVRILLAGHHVIAGGGGGVPVPAPTDADPTGSAEASAEVRLPGVIDKDYVAARLAVVLNARMLLFATDVQGVYDDFESTDARLRPTLSARQARELLAAGTLAPGSMAPKLASAVEFVEATGRAALILHTSELGRALGRTHPGTVISADQR